MHLTFGSPGGGGVQDGGQDLQQHQLRWSRQCGNRSQRKTQSSLEDAEPAVRTQSHQHQTSKHPRHSGKHWTKLEQTVWNQQSEEDAEPPERTQSQLNGRRATNTRLTAIHAPLKSVFKPEMVISLSWQDNLVSDVVAKFQQQFRQWRPGPHAW